MNDHRNRSSKMNYFIYFTSITFLSTNSLRKYRAFSHDVTVAILVFQNNDMAAMLVFQTNPMGVELFSYVNNFFLSPQICIDADHASENALYREQSEEFVRLVVVIVVCKEYPIEHNLPFHQSDQEVQGDQIVHCHPKKQMNK